MRVLQVINSLDTGGAEKLVLDTVPRYVAADIPTDVLVLNGTAHPFFTKMQQLQETTIYSLGTGSVYNPMHVFRIRKFLKRYDLIHVHLFPALYWVALAKVFSFTKTPLLFTEHNTTNRRRGNWFFKILDKIIYKRYRKIITISSEVDAGIQTHLGFNSDRFVYIPNGVAIDAIAEAKPASREELGIPKEQKIILQVASFTSQKDQKTLIQSMVLLQTNTLLLLVGDGPLKAEMKELAHSLGLEDHVRFLGIRMDVPRLLRLADIVVLSSHYEGLSLSSIEALASGKPFVATDAPGLTEIVEDAGILFPIGDSKKLAEIIDELFQNKQWYANTVARCVERAQQFSLDKMIAKHLELYRSCIQNVKTDYGHG